MAKKVNGHHLEKDEVTGILFCVKCSRESTSERDFKKDRCKADEEILDQRRSGVENKKKRFLFFKSGG